MRTLIISLLLASTAAAPALAQDDGERGRGRDRVSQSSDDSERVRPQRAERQRAMRDADSERVRPERAERQRSMSDGGETVRPQRAERQRSTEEPARERRFFVNRERRSRDVAPVTTDVQVETPEVRVSRPADSGTTNEVRRSRRGDSWADRVVDMRRARNGDAVVVDRDRDRTTTPTRTENRWSRNDRRWDNHWRSDRRYDWRRHRDRNRSIFRFGNYWDPYGYRYRRFSIGFNMWPSYYQSNYWLNDPWMYRLPPAYGPYRWVRYWDDALLVNIYTGRVVDVVHNFFW